MAWVAAHMSPASCFVVASCAMWWPADSVGEWFPALASRASVVAPNGAEWLPRGEFKLREEAYVWLKACTAVAGPCLDALSASFGVGFTHVYVSKPAVGGANRLTGAWPGDRLGFVAVYDGPGATVYARRQRGVVGTPRTVNARVEAAAERLELGEAAKLRDLLRELRAQQIQNV